MSSRTQIPESFMVAITEYFRRVAATTDSAIQPGVVTAVDRDALTVDLITHDGAGGQLTGVPYMSGTPAVEDRVYYLDLGGSTVVITGGRGSTVSTRAAASSSYRPVYVGRAPQPPMTATGYQTGDRIVNSQPAVGTPAEWVLCTDGVWRGIGPIGG